MKKTLCFDVLWIITAAAAMFLLFYPHTQAVFVKATNAHPLFMGFIKFAALASMGELLAMRIGGGKWTANATEFWQKALVWGFLGLIITVMIMVFSAGTDLLVKNGLLPVPCDPKAAAVTSAFYKSMLMNIFFGFEFMVFHRITDTLISQGRLFSKWPLAETTKSINWENMYKVVGLSVFWFWVPAHTITFSLPPAFRTACAAFLSIALGIILSFARRKSQTR